MTELPAFHHPQPGSVFACRRAATIRGFRVAGAAALKNVSVRIGAIFLLLAVSAAPAAASPLSIFIGSFSFDTFIADVDALPPGPGTNAFNITNYTGAAALDADAATPLLFSDLRLTLTTEALAETAITLADDLGPGPLVEAGAPLVALQSPSTTLFLSARLQGIVNSASFVLADGNVFTATSELIDVLLLPSIGDFLNPGDVVGITLEGESAPASSVPEPPAVVLLVSGLLILSAYRTRRQTIKRE